MIGYSKRTDKRFYLTVPVIVEKNGVLRRYFIKNISSGGVLIEIDKYSDFKKGDIIKIIFSLPGMDFELIAEGEICHITEIDKNRLSMGIKFIKFLKPDSSGYCLVL